MDNRPANSAELRHRAEEIAPDRADQLPECIAALSLDETQRLLNELRVHQIELELQNEELRRVQLELQASQTQYFDLYDLAPVGYVTLSEEGLILQANLAAAVLLGVPRGQLVKQRLSRFIVRDDEATYYGHRKQLLETGAPQAYELRMVKEDGTTFWVHLVATTASDAAGQAAFHVVLTDVTERKRMEAELRESEASRREQAVLLESETLFRSVLNSMLANIVVLDRQGTIRTVNDAWTRFALQNGKEPTLPRVGVGVNYLEICESAGDESRPILQGLRGVLSGSQNTFSCEYCCDSPSEPRWFIMHASSLSEGNGGAVVVHTDITDRKRAELTLQVATDRLSLATSAGGVGIWDYDVVHDCLVWDEQMYRLYGVTPEQFSGAYAAWQAGVHPEDGQRGDEEIQRALRGEQEFNTEFRVLWPNGTIRNVRALAFVQRDASGRPLRMIGTNWDITAQKQAEDRLRESEGRFRMMADCAPVLIWMSGEDKLCTYFNRPWFEFTDRTLAQERGNGWAEGVHPEDMAGCLETYVAAFDARKPFTMEYRLRRKDGEFRWILDNGVPRFGTDGAFAGYIGSCVDITEQRYAGETQQRFERLFHDSPVMMALSSLPERRFVDVNDAFLRMLGYAKESVLGKSAAELALFVDPEQHAAVAKRLLAQGRITDLEVRVRRSDGVLLDSQFSGEIVYNEGKQYLLSVMVDVTARKQAETRLAEEASRRRLLFDQSPDGIVILDPTTAQIVEFNEAAHRQLGYSREEFARLRVPDLEAAETPTEVQAHIAEVMRTGRADFETLQRTRQGEIRNMHVTSQIIKIAGQPVYYCFWRDITARKQAEAALQERDIRLEQATARATEMAVRAEAANVAKSDFLANMSHEIRTPMNGVIGMTGLLLNTELDEEQRHYAETVRISGESLLALLNDILDLSKIEAGRLELELLNFDLPAVLDDFAALLAVRAQDKGLEFICAAAPDVPAALCGDPGRLRQILLNLAGNALKFTRQGEVAVRVSLVSETATDVLLRFSVQDTGIGIPAEKQELLFQKFSQADVSTTRQFGGTGLGLAISKQLAKQMGGEIGVRSEVGQGAEFWFTVRLGKQAAGTRTASPLATHLHGVRVLVVDDNATQREVLLTQLTAWGLRPEAAPDGPTALQMLLRAQVAGDPMRVALLDLQMPGMDGAALAQAIRADTTLQTPRLVLMTAVNQRDHAQRLEEHGFAAYLSKPVRQSELHDCLTTVLAETAVTPAVRSRVTRHAGHTLRRLRRGGPRILLAEDNIVNQQVAQGILKKMGLRADTVANGLEALQALASLPYDLVLMDVQMPELGGLEATRHIRDSQSPLPNPHLPIIAMTANAMQGDRECCLAAGMNDYVTKPLVPQALADALDKWLPPDPVAMTDAPPEPAAATPAGSAQEAATPVFDKPDMMARLMDDADLAREIVTLFLGEIPRKIAMLRGALTAGDGPSAVCQAHNIKGASANLGGKALQAVACDIEQAAKAGELASAVGRLAELEAQFDRLQLAMRQELGLTAG